MLSYQHAYHAGNAADLHKHAALAALLTALTGKPRGISYLESHAGRGLYDIASQESKKTLEAASGIERVHPGGPYNRALSAIRAAEGPSAYPGSPLIARTLLRAQDRLTLCELHPGEHRALVGALAGPGVAIHRRDGHEALPALSPPVPRRGLALIDPSYEVKSEYAAAAETALAVLKRWPEGVVMLWYPILPAGRHRSLLGILKRGLPDGRLISEARFREHPARGMTGSGLAILNPPYGIERVLADAWAPLEAVLDFD